jgi:signal transduction histidine kinase
VSGAAVTWRGAGVELDHPGLLPSALLGEGLDGRPPRRSTRDWFVDVVAFAFAVTVGIVVFVTEPSTDDLPDWLLFLDLLTGGLFCVALWWRRRWPAHLAVVAALLGTFSAMSSGAGIVAIFTVAVHRRAGLVAVITALNIATSLIYFRIRPDEELPFLVTIAFIALILGIVVAWGMFVRARRQLVVSLRERAQRAEAEQQLRVEQARHLERTRIAREMHDVLAHRISLVSVHAGALEFRSDAPPEDVAKSAAVIRESAHQALQDLREILGVLRAGVAGAEAPVESPQPTLADVTRLAAESRQAGMKVLLHLGIEDPAAVPTSAGRTAYRVVQEGLTNVRKHAPGVEARITISGSAAAGLTVEVRNRRPVGHALDPAIPGAGQGIAGVAERVDIAGGTLDHGWQPTGDFLLRAWLPWPHDRE